MDSRVATLCRDLKRDFADEGADQDSDADESVRDDVLACSVELDPPELFPRESTPETRNFAALVKHHHSTHAGRERREVLNLDAEGPQTTEPGNNYLKPARTPFYSLTLLSIMHFVYWDDLAEHDSSFRVDGFGHTVCVSILNFLLQINYALRTIVLACLHICVYTHTNLLPLCQ